MTLDTEGPPYQDEASLTIKDLKRLANWKKKENWCPKHGINLHLGQLEDGRRVYFCPALGEERCKTIRFIRRNK